jgi:hypothetical protein
VGEQEMSVKETALCICFTVSSIELILITYGSTRTWNPQQRTKVFLQEVGRPTTIKKRDSGRLCDFVTFKHSSQNFKGSQTHQNYPINGKSHCQNSCGRVLAQENLKFSTKVFYVKLVGKARAHAIAPRCTQYSTL